MYRYSFDVFKGIGPNVFAIFLLRIRLRILKLFEEGLRGCFDISDGGWPRTCFMMLVSRCLLVSPIWQALHFSHPNSCSFFVN